MDTVATFCESHFICLTDATPQSRHHFIPTKEYCVSVYECVVAYLQSRLQVATSSATLF